MYAQPLPTQTLHENCCAAAANLSFLAPPFTGLQGKSPNHLSVDLPQGTELIRGFPRLGLTSWFVAAQDLSPTVGTRVDVVGSDVLRRRDKIILPQAIHNICAEFRTSRTCMLLYTHTSLSIGFISLLLCFILAVATHLHHFIGLR